MVEEITTFKASSGKAFDTPYEAWKEEFRSWLVAHGADNAAIAAHIVKSVDDGQPETLAKLAQIVTNMQRCAPVTSAPRA